MVEDQNKRNKRSIQRLEKDHLYSGEESDFLCHNFSLVAVDFYSVYVGWGTVGWEDFTKLSRDFGSLTSLGTKLDLMNNQEEAAEKYPRLSSNPRKAVKF